MYREARIDARKALGGVNAHPSCPQWVGFSSRLASSGLAGGLDLFHHGLFAARKNASIRPWT
jgi:hypothetical protein